MDSLGKARRCVIQICAQATPARSRWAKTASNMPAEGSASSEPTLERLRRREKNECNLPTSSFQRIAYTLLSVPIAPHHHGVSESVRVDRVKAVTFSKTRNPSCEIVHDSRQKNKKKKKKNAASIPKLHIASIDWRKSEHKNTCSRSLWNSRREGNEENPDGHQGESTESVTGWIGGGN